MNCFQGNFTAQSGYDLMKEAIQNLGDQLPPAFFAASDSLAIGALRVRSKKLESVPETVSASFPLTTPAWPQVYPLLSSITVYTEEMWGEQVWIFLKEV